MITPPPPSTSRRRPAAAGRQPSGFHRAEVTVTELGAGTPLELGAADDVELLTVAGDPPPAEPVLAARAALVRVAALLRRRRATTELDVERAVLLVAQAEPAERAPLRRRWSVGGQAVLVVERSPALALYRVDADQIAEAVLRAAPSARVVEAPPRLDLAELASRGTGGRFVVFTDLAIGQPQLGMRSRRPWDWAEFSRQVAASRGDVIFLTPYPPGDVPPPARALRPVQWSDGLSVRACARAGAGRR